MYMKEQKNIKTITLIIFLLAVLLITIPANAKVASATTDANITAQNNQPIIQGNAWWVNLILILIFAAIVYWFITYVILNRDN